MPNRWLQCFVCLILAAVRMPAQEPPQVVAHGRLETINGCRVISVSGTPQEMGTAYGKLLGKDIQRVIAALITNGFAKEDEAYQNVLKGSETMARHQPPEFLEELKAISRAADVKYEDLLLLQYFGDVRRGIRGAGAATMCTSFAILPPRTRGKTCIVGRNLDYFDEGVGNYASLLAYYQPKDKIPFVTVTWVGIINGWTLLNAKGLVVSNNTAFGGKNSLEGVSTCNLLRYVAENCGTLAAATALIRKTPKACCTIMLVASGDEADAVIVEFDHEQLAIRKPENGFVGGANTYQVLLRKEPRTEYTGRIATACRLQAELKPPITIDQNLAGAEGVPIESMNLHSAMIDATARRLRVAMGAIPAYKRPYRAFRLTERGLVADDTKTPEMDRQPE